MMTQALIVLGPREEVYNSWTRHFRLGCGSAEPDQSVIRTKWSKFKSKSKSRNLYVVDDLKQSPTLYFQIVSLPCYYCGIEFAGGIDRVDSNRGYEWDNMVASCTACNMFKKALPLGHFLNVVNAMYHWRHDGVATTSHVTFAKCGERHQSFKRWKHDIGPERSATATLTEDEFIRLNEGACHYCGLKNAKGIDRLDSSGNYETKNCVSACCVCNYLKGSLSTTQLYGFVDIIQERFGDQSFLFEGITTIFCRNWLLTRDEVSLLA